MKELVKEIEAKIESYKSILEKEPLDYGDGVVEGLEEALSLVKNLTIPNVSRMFSKEQMKEAFSDGVGCGETRMGHFNIENYD